MSEIKEIQVPVIYDDKNRKWLLLNDLSNSGFLKAVKISKPAQIPDDDTHHCNQVSVQKSIRYHPKKWKIN